MLDIVKRLIEKHLNNLKNKVNTQMTIFELKRQTIKYTVKGFKKPFRHTDLCHYCEFGKDIIKEIKSEFKIHNIIYEKEFDSDHLNNFV